MAKIVLKTYIKADRKVVFDLSRSIDLHKISTASTNEKAIAGKTKGLIGLGEQVTWRAKHLGFYQTLTSKITQYDFPIRFTDEMAEGIFKKLKHQHIFKEKEEGTLMTDVFEFESPWGILGRMANTLFLKRYLQSFLVERNQVIKTYAESGDLKIIRTTN